MVGLKPKIAAIEIDRDVWLANKETLVVGGHLSKDLLSKHKVDLRPIDSEHNAIWQLLHSEDKSSIKKLIITASGGSFRDYSREALKTVTLADALKHPNWSMGDKITIDSATMMNKGFEMIEAAYLFDLDIQNIEAVLHPESIVHGMVEYVDHSIAALLATPDMRMPISYAMFYPKRQTTSIQPLDISQLSALHFSPIDQQRYPLLGIALEAFKKGGSTRTVLNAANEAAVKLFLNQKIGFLDIEDIVIDYVREHQPIADPSLEEIYHIDADVKQEIYQSHGL
jgi:1-deoxy-D-xylulose-5-phosphate reductoisomerase